jgi:hypothetical protein
VGAAGLVGVEGGDDVGVAQPGRRLDLAMEALDGGRLAGQSFRQHLQGDVALHDVMPGLVHRPHAAGPDQAE